jgi:RND family efflux transporter MFP subunit
MTSTPDLSSLRIRRDDDAPSGGSGRGRAWGIAVVLLVLAGAAAWFLVLAPRQAIAVRAATVNATGGGTASSAGITANGYVVARTHASVSAKILGRLASLRVDEGSVIRKGDVIATIDDADYRAQLAAAKAAEAQIVVQLEQANRDLERARQLRQGGMVSAVDLEGAQTRAATLEAQLQSARAQTQLAQASYENTRVLAPFNGTVLRKDAEVGEIVAPSKWT